MSLGPLMIDLAGSSATAEERELLRHPLVGGVILFTRNYTDPEQLTALVGAIHAERTPPLIVAVDHEGGRLQRFRQGFSLLPPARRIGHEFDLDARAGLALSRAMGWLMAAELRAHGVDISFAPCVDLDHGVSIIGDRAFHALPDAVGQLAVAWMHGMRDAGMAATAKHFPGHGAVVADSHLTLPVDRRPLPDLAPDLAPYRRLMANALPAVMVAHSPTPSAVRIAARSVGAVRKLAAAWDWWCSAKRTFRPGTPRCEEMMPRTQTFSPREFFIAFGNARQERGKARRAHVRMRSNFSIGFS